MATNCPCTGTDTLFRDVRAIVPGVTDPIVHMELYNTLREFCRRSLAVRADTEDTVPAGVQDFVLADTDFGWQVIRVLNLRSDQGYLQPRPVLRMAQPVVGLEGYWCREPNHVFFGRTLNEDTQVNGVAALGPGLSCAANCSTVPKIIWDEHYEAIRAGTLGRLYMQPAKPYTNLVLARTMMGRAHSLTGEARVMADKTETMADPTWVYPRWAPR